MMKILIVDDSTFSQRTTANLIKKFLDNIEIYFSSDGKEGFIQYKNIRPDYIFLDLLMFKLSGKELLLLIKEFDIEAKVFAISADVQNSVRKEIEKHNILGFINKPFNWEKAKLVCEIIRKDINE